MDGAARNLSNVAGHSQTAASAHVLPGTRPSGFSRSVTRERNESSIFRETSTRNFARSPTEAVQCGSLTRLLITIVSRTMSSIDRKSGRPCGGKYKSPVSETMRCDIRDCETAREPRDSPTRVVPSILIRTIIPLSSGFFIFFARSLFGRMTEAGSETRGKAERKRKMEG